MSPREASAPHRGAAIRRVMTPRTLLLATLVFAISCWGLFVFWHQSDLPQAYFRANDARASNALIRHAAAVPAAFNWFGDTISVREAWIEEKQTPSFRWYLVPYNPTVGQYRLSFTLSVQSPLELEPFGRGAGYIECLATGRRASFDFDQDNSSTVYHCDVPSFDANCSLRLMSANGKDSMGIINFYIRENGA